MGREEAAMGRTAARVAEDQGDTDASEDAVDGGNHAVAVKTIP